MVSQGNINTVLLVLFSLGTKVRLLLGSKMEDLFQVKQTACFVILMIWGHRKESEGSRSS